jgi:hypothetical protein
MKLSGTTLSMWMSTGLLDVSKKKKKKKKKKTPTAL